MTEAELQAAVLELAGWKGLLAYHNPDSRRSQAGFPDLVLVGKVVLFAELKDEYRGLSSEQTAWRWRLLAAGQRWVLWRPAHWRTGIIETTLREIA